MAKEHEGQMAKVTGSCVTNAPRGDFFLKDGRKAFYRSGGHRLNGVSMGSLAVETWERLVRGVGPEGCSCHEALQLEKIRPSGTRSPNSWRRRTCPGTDPDDEVNGAAQSDPAEPPESGKVCNAPLQGTDHRQTPVSHFWDDSTSRCTG